MTRPLRLGTGAGFSVDRLDPACELINKGRPDYAVFECIRERRLAFGHRDRMRDGDKGYNALLENRFQATLPLFVKHGTRVVTNMGVANPRAAARRTRELVAGLDLLAFRIAWVEGDDVARLVNE